MSGTATVPLDLLNEVTAVLLEQPAGRVFDLLTRLRAEVTVEGEPGDAADPTA